AGAEIVMLDNMTVADIRESVRLIRNVSPTTTIEASGGVTLDNVLEIAEAGVDLISVGALTHSAVAVDISMKLSPL
ncbi:MAG TPA: nicotinate-nucleotide diphosphorylase (carboxylating), partial [Blastocatellia bacterium]